MRADGKSILCPLLLLAGPAISFVGSPTLSPTTIVACVGFLLPSDSPAHQTQQRSNHGATPEQDPSNDLPQRACWHTSARGLREFDAAASHPRTTTKV